MKFSMHLFFVLFLVISCEKDTLPKDVKLIINNSTNKVELMNFINNFRQNPYNDKLSFFADNTNDENKLITIEIDNASSIDEIKFLPINDGNCINENEFYKLYYWNYEWISLGVQKGGKTITFENVPCNSLLLLKNSKGRIENRIFGYKDEKQLFC